MRRVIRVTGFEAAQRCVTQGWTISHAFSLGSGMGAHEIYILEAPEENEDDEGFDHGG